MDVSDTHLSLAFILGIQRVTTASATGRKPHGEYDSMEKALYRHSSPFGDIRRHGGGKEGGGLGLLGGICNRQVVCSLRIAARFPSHVSTIHGDCVVCTKASLLSRLNSTRQSQRCGFGETRRNNSRSDNIDNNDDTRLRLTRPSMSPSRTNRRVIESGRF